MRSPTLYTTCNIRRWSSATQPDGAAVAMVATDTRLLLQGLQSTVAQQKNDERAGCCGATRHHATAAPPATAAAVAQQQYLLLPRFCNPTEQCILQPAEHLRGNYVCYCMRSVAKLSSQASYQPLLTSSVTQHYFHYLTVKHIKYGMLTSTCSSVRLVHVLAMSSAKHPRT